MSLVNKMRVKQKVSCDLCGCQDHNYIGEKSFPNICTTKKSFSFWVHLSLCKQCGLVFQSSKQDDFLLREYYENMFREEPYRPDKAKQKQFALRVNFALKFLKKGNSVLEIGCSDGSTLVGFKKAGLRVSGIEPSRQNVVACRRKGIRVFNSTYEDFWLNYAGPKRWNLLCSYYLMEHVVSPMHFMSFCNSFLDMNGIVYIEIPDLANYGRIQSPSDLLFFFEHQFHFTKDTVRLLLQRCGFELVEFSNAVSRPFGMHFAARKVRSPISANDLEVQSPKVVGHIMKLVSRAIDLQNEKELLFRRKLHNLIKMKLLTRKGIVIFGGRGDYTLKYFYLCQK